MEKAVIKKILEAAVQAPSGDNMQPWRFEVADDYSYIKLFNLPEKDDSYYNYQQVASYIAHGAVIENIEISAQQLGFKAEIELFPDVNNCAYVAKITFSAIVVEKQPLYEAIFSRCTNRFFYQRSDISLSFIQDLVAAVQQLDGVKAYFVSDRQKIAKLAKVLKVNDQLVFERQDMHGFLFSTIRWSAEEEARSKDGMPVDTLGLNPVEKLFFPLMRYWWFISAANYVGLSQIIALKCWYGCYKASLLGEITISQTDTAGFVNAGRAMQRVWLMATQQGLAAQPIVGLPLLIFRAQQNALGAFSEKQQKVVIEANTSLIEIFEIDPDENIVIGFRIGKGRAVSAKTLRNQVDLI
jgi:hypothetical protein